MGSSGSGSFSDYSKRKPIDEGAKTGGSSGVDKCGKAFSTSLEDVGRCYYVMNKGSVPPSRTEIILAFNGVRLVVETKSKEELGYLPTKLNYLKSCLDSGIEYVGTVQLSSMKPSPSIIVDMVPKK